MNLIRNLFSSLISFILVPLIFVLILINSFFGVLLNSTTFKGILSDNKAYERLATNVFPSLLVNLTSHSDSNSTVPPKALSDIIDKIDKKVLAADLEKAVNASYDFVTSDEEHFEVKIDLISYTTPLATSLKPTVIDYYNNLPACTKEEQANIDPTSLGNISCKPTNLSTDQYIKSLQVDDLINEIKTSFPTQLIINDQEVTTYPQTNFFGEQTLNKEQNSNNTSTLQTLQKSVQAYKSTIQFLLISILVLLAILGATRLPNIASSCKWISSALSAAAILPLVGSSISLYFLKPDSFTKLLENTIGNSLGTNFQTATVSLLRDVLFDYTQKSLQQMQIISVTVIVIAIIFYVIYFFLEQRSKHPGKKPLDAVLNKTHNIVR